jgi:hypothetical protein
MRKILRPHARGPNHGFTMTNGANSANHHNNAAVMNGPPNPANGNCNTA